MRQRVDLFVALGLAICSIAACVLSASLQQPRQPRPRLADVAVVRPTAAPSPSPLPTATPKPTPVPTDRPVTDPQAAAAIILEVFGPRYGSGAVRVAGCESTGDTTAPIRIDPAARNGDHYGAFQLRRRFHEARARALGLDWGRMTELEPNARVAFALFAAKGFRWSPTWSCAWAA